MARQRVNLYEDRPSDALGTVDIELHTRTERYFGAFLGTLFVVGWFWLVTVIDRPTSGAVTVRRPLCNETEVIDA